MNRNTVSDLMCYLEKAGIINQLRAETEGVRLLGKVDKVYLHAAVGVHRHRVGKGGKLCNHSFYIIT